jgi:hypothetical protein
VRIDDARQLPAAWRTNCNVCSLWATYPVSINVAESSLSNNKILFEETQPRSSTRMVGGNAAAIAINSQSLRKAPFRQL